MTTAEQLALDAIALASAAGVQLGCAPVRQDYPGGSYELMMCGPPGGPLGLGADAIVAARGFDPGWINQITPTESQVAKTYWSNIGEYVAASQAGLEPAGSIPPVDTSTRPVGGSTPVGRGTPTGLPSVNVLPDYVVMPTVLTSSRPIASAADRERLMQWLVFKLQLAVLGVLRKRGLY